MEQEKALQHSELQLHHLENDRLPIPQCCQEVLQKAQESLPRRGGELEGPLALVPLRNIGKLDPGGPLVMWGYLALLPIFLAVWAMVGVWTIFALAVSNKSVNLTDGFPYISLCGSFPPQSCIFGQLLNVGAILVAWICILRYLQLREWGVPKFSNQLCLGMGFLCALGASIVGNFQQTNELSTHLFGSFLAFVVGVAYFWTQLVLLHLTKPQTQPGAPWIEPLRLLLCAACTILMVTMVVLHLWPLRSAAAMCEWSVAMILFALFGLLAVDFSELSGFVISLQSRPTSCPQSTAHLSSL